ncbi:MAG: yagE [Firmicutes bacterium]|nr:yagE [Bacillota bacterium]
MFKGVLSPIITILDEQGRIDFKGNETHINRLIDNGINGILFLGSIGEFFALSMEEKKEFIKFAIKTVNKRVPVLIGTGGTVQAEVIELTRFAEQAGADAAVVISPYYFKLNTETIYQYYASIARSTSLPIVLYNFPDRLMAGGDGVLCGLTNIIPQVFAGLMNAYAAKDLDKVAVAQAKISLLMNLYDVSQPFIAGIKGAAAATGHPFVPAVKEPATGLTTTQLQTIQELLKKAEATQS